MVSLPIAIIVIALVTCTLAFFLSEILKGDKRYADLQLQYTLAIIELETVKFVLDLERKLK